MPKTEDSRAPATGRADCWTCAPFRNEDEGLFNRAGSRARRCPCSFRPAHRRVAGHLRLFHQAGYFRSTSMRCARFLQGHESRSGLPGAPPGQLRNFRAHRGRRAPQRESCPDKSFPAVPKQDLRLDQGCFERFREIQNDVRSVLGQKRKTRKLEGSSENTLHLRICPGLRVDRSKTSEIASAASARRGAPIPACDNIESNVSPGTTSCRDMGQLPR